MKVVNGEAKTEVRARPTPLARTRQLLELDREDIVVIVIYGVALGLLSLAVPIAVQSLVNTVAFGSLFQPLVVLTVLLAVALIGSAVLRALQVRIAEMLQRRLFVRIVAEISGRLPRVSAPALQAANGPELLNRFFDVFTTQKSIASLLLGGIDALLIALVGLVVLAFYHPALLAFDIVLILGAGVVLIPLGRGGKGRASPSPRQSTRLQAGSRKWLATPFRSSSPVDRSSRRTAPSSSPGTTCRSGTATSGLCLGS